MTTRNRMSLLPGERMTIRVRYLTLKLRALCWVLRRVRAGAFLRSTPGNQTASCSRNHDGRWKRGYAEKRIPAIIATNSLVAKWPVPTFSQLVAIGK